MAQDCTNFIESFQAGQSLIRPVFSLCPILLPPHLQSAVFESTSPKHLLLTKILLESVFPVIRTLINDHIVQIQIYRWGREIICRIRVFSSKLALRIKWPKYWNFSFSISPCYEYLGLISFRIDWFDLLAVQGTLKGLLQHHGSKASILPCSAFFMAHLSHAYITKTIACYKNKLEFVRLG